MAENKEPSCQEWIVATGGGTLLSGHPTEDGANARCASANAEAAKLGISTRYGVQHNGAAPRAWRGAE